MKASVLSSLVILSVAALFGWKRHGDLVSVREVHREVSEEARALGLSPDSLVAAGLPPSRQKADRGGAEDKIVEAKAFSRELIAFAKEMKAVEMSGGPPDEDLQKRIMETLARFMDLSPSQIRTVIAEIKDSPELDDEMRRGIVGFSIMMLANDQPEAALEMYTETSDVEGMGGMGEHVLATALGKWAEKDPFAALDWIRKNSKERADLAKDLVNERTKAAIIAGAAKQDPKLALSLIDEIGLEEPHQQAGALVRSVRGAEERDALIAALRADDKRAELLKTTLTTLGGQLAGEGFDSSEAWLSSAGLSETETTAIAEGLSPWQAGDDIGKWIGWMEGKLPDDALDRKVGDFVSQWTGRDYRAAGEWISSMEQGPARQSAVKSYAKTLAPYEPEAAEQWAATLPAGKDRDEVLAAIRANRKKEGDGDIQWSAPDGE